ncbi:hypothetical protein [Hyphomonas johnsonii]|uniref:Lipoprotein n=1 Tax=Hyphomonas johnsonii MHS-2 TaxID=1280950 RepID=A0A059FG25_9PROT|nr:hypothetical protein [Hyphomonas johnsonii]KCZ89473.1 hypothetical protein HJO_14682 [Hyphomonas johnsonii MHS-2]
MARVLRLWLAGVVAALSCGVAAAQGAPEIVPPGWAMRVSTNSVYLTRPDMPQIQVAIVNDVRPELTQEEKFESAKAYFADRAHCPALAQAETQGSFAGLFASDDPVRPHCRLIGMGHWVKDGLQMAVIVNSQPALGPKADSYAYQAITQQIVELFTLRYQLSQSDQTPTPTAEGYARSIPRGHKPVMIVDMVRSQLTELFMTAAWEPVGNHTAMLFARESDTAPAWGSHCLDWDPTLFAPGDILVHDKTGQCLPFLWRWKDGRENGTVEARGMGQPEWKSLRAFEADFNHFDEDSRIEMVRAYRPFKKGTALDVAFGEDTSVLKKVAAGTLPAAALGKHDIILAPDGKFIAGTVRSATLPGGKAEGGVTGSYYVDGHAMTLLLDNGHVVEGFAGWLDAAQPAGLAPPVAGATFSNSSSLNINGWTYYSR